MSDKNQIELPKYWVKRVSRSRNGKTYYFNTKTRQSVWKLSDISDTSVEESSIVTGTKIAKNNSPDKRLRKIQNAPTFKRNLAENRLKALQTTLKKEQDLKTQLIDDNKVSPSKQRVKNSNSSSENPKKSSIPTDNNDNSAVKPPVPTTNTEANNKSALTKYNVTNHDLSKKYKDFILNLFIPNSNNHVKNEISTQKDDTSVVPTDAHAEDSLQSEPMDWEYTGDDVSTLTLNQTVEKTVDTSDNKGVDVPLDSFETMEQYLSYKNLINDEQEMDQKYFYVVVDTNIFLSNLDFIDKLIKIKFKNYGYPAIVVPYIVFQELDKIKCRFESKFTTLAVKAKSAIHYLNEKLKDHHKQFCGQSATEDAQKLISITSQDDDIVNCLVQVKDKAKGTVILLSNDKNLRNKVMVTGINSYSASELEKNKDSLQFFISNDH